MRRFDNPNLDLLLNKHQCSSRAHMCFLSGKRAFLNGDNIDACPFSDGSVSRTMWEKGWRLEFFDNFDVVASLV